MFDVCKSNTKVNYREFWNHIIVQKNRYISNKNDAWSELIMTIGSVPCAIERSANKHLWRTTGTKFWPEIT